MRTLIRYFPYRQAKLQNSATTVTGPREDHEAIYQELWPQVLARHPDFPRRGSGGHDNHVVFLYRNEKDGESAVMVAAFTCGAGATARVDRRDRVRLEPGDCAPPGAENDLDFDHPESPESWEPEHWFV